MQSHQDDDRAGLKRLRAGAHPLRSRILSLLTGADLSAVEVAREVGITQANASYHLRTLERAELVRVASTEKIRGGVAKRYRYSSPDGESVRLSGRESAVTWQRTVEAQSLELARRALKADTSRRGAFCDVETWVDPATFAKVEILVTEAARLMHENARPVRAPGSVHASLITNLFVMTAAAGPADAAGR